MSDDYSKYYYEIGSMIADRIKLRIREGRVVSTEQNARKKTSGTTLLKSSRLANSIRHFVRGDTIYIGTPVKYAEIHHKGGDIIPNNAQSLAIPIHDTSKNKSPKDFPNLEKIVLPDSNNPGKFICYLGIKAKTKRQRDILLFVLKKRVHIPTRPYMFLDKDDRDFVMKRIEGFLAAMMKKGKK